MRRALLGACFLLGSAGALNLLPVLDDETKEGLAALNRLLQLAEDEPEELAAALGASSFAALAPELFGTEARAEARSLLAEGGGSSSGSLPVVLAHGMGDACENSGMAGIVEEVGAYVGAYAVCFPIGDSRAQDTINGFLMDMDSSVDIFAEKVRADPQLEGGFDAIGFSQGNSLLRGYIQRYNDPPVRRWISAFGTAMGVAALPNCDPAPGARGKAHRACEDLALVLGRLAYTELVQGILFQANYYRLPTALPGATNDTAYADWSQIAAWNGEERGGVVPNEDFRRNFGRTELFYMVMGEADTVVTPREASHWGYFREGGFDEVVPMEDTRVYEADSFGLRTAREQGKILLSSVPGNHMQFTEEELFRWIDEAFGGMEP